MRILPGEAIDLAGFFDGKSGERFALHESALYRVKRRQFMMTGLQGAQAGINAEETPDEVFHVGRELDDQLGTGLCRECGRIGARFEKARIQWRRCFKKLVQKKVVELCQTFVREKIIKG